MTTNCPNCAAPITGARCEYCGTRFERPTVSGQPPAHELFNKARDTGVLTVNEIRASALGHNYFEYYMDDGLYGSYGDWPSPPTLDTR